MCTLNSLYMIQETNELVLSLMMEQLVRQGQKSKELLGKISVLTNLNSEEDDSIPIELKAEEIEKLNKIFLNIISLLDFEDKDCINACKQYVKTFKSLLNSYPRFRKLEFSEIPRTKYKKIKEKFTNNNSYQDILIELEDIKNLLYKN